jgi:hypothetical protein
MASKGKNARARNVVGSAPVESAPETETAEGSAPEGSAVEGSAPEGSAVEGSAVEGSAEGSEGSAPEGSAEGSEGSAPEGSAVDPLAEYGSESAPVAPAVPRSRSEGVALSWRARKPDGTRNVTRGGTLVRVDRKTRNRVAAGIEGGTLFVYDSLRDAFRALRLPDEKHIGFRTTAKLAERANRKISGSYGSADYRPFRSVFVKSESIRTAEGAEVIEDKRYIFEILDSLPSFEGDARGFLASLSKGK